LRNKRWFHLHLFEKPLNTPIMGFDLGMPWKRRGEFGKIDGFDFEQSDNEIRETRDASEMPPKVELEQVDEHGRMIHGVIS
jgi:hypothetical protein